MKTLLLRSGARMPVLGQGTWGMGESAAARDQETSALRTGLDLGLTLIDTAEMYAEGGAEVVVGKAIDGRRAEVFLVSKVYPHNATARGVIKSCEGSLKRLGTNYLDLYLLHWRGSVPLEETFAAFQSLQSSGKILAYGVSNFDQPDMEGAFGLEPGTTTLVNQVLYNLYHRGIEWDLVPWCREHEVVTMAYSPIENSGADQKRILEHPSLKNIAAGHGATPVQVALAWLLSQNAVVIPKASQVLHVRENRAAPDLALTKEDLKEIDRAFPPPTRKLLRHEMNPAARQAATCERSERINFHEWFPGFDHGPAIANRWPNSNVFSKNVTHNEG